MTDADDPADIFKVVVDMDIGLYNIEYRPSRRYIRLYLYVI